MTIKSLIASIKCFLLAHLLYKFARVGTDIIAVIAQGSLSFLTVGERIPYLIYFILDGLVTILVLGNLIISLMTTAVYLKKQRPSKFAVIFSFVGACIVSFFYVGVQMSTINAVSFSSFLTSFLVILVSGLEYHDFATNDGPAAVSAPAAVHAPAAEPSKNEVPNMGKTINYLTIVKVAILICVSLHRLINIIKSLSHLDSIPYLGVIIIISCIVCAVFTVGVGGMDKKTNTILALVFNVIALLPDLIVVTERVYYLNPKHGPYIYILFGLFFVLVTTIIELQKINRDTAGAPKSDIPVKPEINSFTIAKIVILSYVSCDRLLISLETLSYYDYIPFWSVVIIVSCIACAVFTLGIGGMDKKTNTILALVFNVIALFTLLFFVLEDITYYLNFKHGPYIFILFGLFFVLVTTILDLQKFNPNTVGAPRADTPARTEAVYDSNTLKKLVEYKQLLDMGVITQAEYDEMKKSILTSAQR